MAPAHLLASYTSPKSTQTFSSELPALPKEEGSRGVEQKTAYLASLRANASKMQGEVNAFLTAKMEEDKATEITKGGTKKSAAEDREEEMYGEEDPENDG